MLECVIRPYHNLCHTQKFSIKNSTFAWLLIHILITLQRLLIMNRSLNLIYICARWLRDSSLMSLEKYFCSTSKYSHNIAKKTKLIPAWMTKTKNLTHTWISGILKIFKNNPRDIIRIFFVWDLPEFFLHVHIPDCMSFAVIDQNALFLMLFHLKFNLVSIKFNKLNQNLFFSKNYRLHLIEIN